MSDMRSMIIGVDVGGTFTDLFFFDEARNEFHVAKVPTSKPDQSQGFLTGIGEGVTDLETVTTIVHGTTVGTNALLERDGARTGIITTQGFRDALEMRRRDRPRTWGLRGDFEPVVPRDFRIEVPERTLADGTVLEAVDQAAVIQAAKDLRAKGADALAIVFVNAYANPENEEAALAAIQSVWPNAYISVSSEILPEIREFERTSTTTLNAYLQPVIGNYLDRLDSALKGDGFQGSVFLVQSNGGVMSLETASDRPIKTALSGPAAGVMAAAYIAQESGFPNVITCDMGGTSFDVSLIADGKSALAAETAVDFGLVVRAPMIEMTTIGAGGGSIAWVDRGGLLQIGPQSAGSDPGPACYGLGNREPTVTDANLLLGRINGERPIGGKLNALDVKAARLAVKTCVGDPLGLDDMAAAEAIIRVANSRMAGAIRLVSIERGHNPGEFSAMPFGGGGALHAGALIKEVGLKNAIVPRFPGITSALGCTIADMRHDFVQTINQMADGLNLDAVKQRMTDFADDGDRLLSAANVAFERRAVLFELDMSYLGQTHTVAVPLNLPDAGAVEGVTTAQIVEAFEAQYLKIYGRVLKDIAIRVLNLRVAVIGYRRKFDLRQLAPKATVPAEPMAHRQVWADNQWHSAAIFDRLSLPIGMKIAGPAILEQSDATIFVDPGLMATVDPFGNLIIGRD